MLIRLRTKGGGLEAIDAEAATIVVKASDGQVVTRELSLDGLSKITVVRSKRPKPTAA